MNSEIIKYRLLLIDDDSSFLKTNKEIMEESYKDIEVVTIGQSGVLGSDNFRSAGQNALDYLARVASGEEAAVHCILIDHNMPGMRGLDLLKEIKKNDNYAPVVMLTGDEEAMQWETIKSFENGTRGYLFKNSNTFHGELNTTIRRVYQEVIREKWLAALAEITSVDVNSITDRQGYAKHVCKNVARCFPRGVIFIRELTKENHLHLLAYHNLPDDLPQRLAVIDINDYPFVKEAFSHQEATFDNEAYKWEKKKLGKASEIPLKFDRAFFVPLRYANEKLGSLSIFLEKSQGFFLEEEKRYANALASVVAAMFFQYEYRRKLQKQARNVTEVIKLFDQATNEEAIYEELARHIHEEINIRLSNTEKGKTSVKIILPGTALLKTKAYLGMPRQQEPEMRALPEGNGISGWVAFHKKARLVLDKDKCQKEWLSTHDDMVSAVTVPLLNEVGRVIAVLNSENTKAGHFNEDDLAYAESLSHVAAVYVTRIRNRHFFDTILGILSDKDSGAGDLLRRVLTVIKEYTGYAAMIVAVKKRDGMISLVRCDGFNREEEYLIVQALQGNLPGTLPLISSRALQDAREYEWNRGDANQGHQPYFPSSEIKERIKSINVFLLRLSSGEPMGAFSLEFEIEHAIDSLQDETIGRILPIIARLLWDAEKHSALSREIDILRVDAAFHIAMRQIAHNLHHLSFNIGGQAIMIEETENLTEAGRENVNKIVEFASELDKLENDIRSLSHEPKPIAMPILSSWQEVEKIFAEKIKQNRIKLLLRIPETSVGYCDPVVLKTVLMNVIDNSIQAILNNPEEGKEPQVLLEYQGSETGGVLRVEDDGPGFQSITPEEAMQWFTTTRSAGGSGIGLPFSAELLRRCGGELKIVAPRELCGAAIEITLPAK